VEICQSLHFSKGLGHFEHKFQTERASPTTVGVRMVDWLPFRVVSNIRSALFGFITKHACDGQTEDTITTPKITLA